VRTAKVRELLLVVPRIGPARADRLLGRCRIAHAKTVAAASPTVNGPNWSSCLPADRCRLAPDGRARVDPECTRDATLMEKLGKSSVLAHV
jgi:hypothetical protein